ncbi:hypothetical protein QJS10_CPB19g00977 [Acorus calamus]|uniref:Uncharacterized protein n=1 Tax=Acorus calamus TaxID=4465 RepID=A0AAV9CDW1_ACOCL|nr:hypothetical protein QJS10_CPB19g00977 [Acorus calamus]
MRLASEFRLSFTAVECNGRVVMRSVTQLQPFFRMGYMRDFVDVGWGEMDRARRVRPVYTPCRSV